MSMKLVSRVFTAILISLLVPGLALSDDGKTYRVTITNLTAGQPLTPPLLVTHTRRTGLFTVGEQASMEIQALAENGDAGPFMAALGSSTQVHDVVAGSAPLLPANDPAGTGFDSSASFTVRASKHARFLSFASMLICTNDGFAGLDTVRLPKFRKVVFAAAYDARTEANTEDFADIVPPCQGLIGVTSDDPGVGMSNPVLAESGIVIPHPGVIGGADLSPHAHGWSDPVAKIVIERVRHDD